MFKYLLLGSCLCLAAEHKLPDLVVDGPLTYDIYKKNEYIALNNLDIQDSGEIHFQNTSSFQEVTATIEVMNKCHIKGQITTDANVSLQLISHQKAQIENAFIHAQNVTIKGHNYVDILNSTITTNLEVPGGAIGIFAESTQINFSAISGKTVCIIGQSCSSKLFFDPKAKHDKYESEISIGFQASTDFFIDLQNSKIVADDLLDIHAHIIKMENKSSLSSFYHTKVHSNYFYMDESSALRALDANAVTDIYCNFTVINGTIGAGELLRIRFLEHIDFAGSKLDIADASFILTGQSYSLDISKIDLIYNARTRIHLKAFDHLIVHATAAVNPNQLQELTYEAGNVIKALALFNATRINILTIDEDSDYYTQLYLPNDNHINAREIFFKGVRVHDSSALNLLDTNLCIFIKFSIVPIEKLTSNIRQIGLSDAELILRNEDLSEVNFDEFYLEIFHINNFSCPETFLQKIKNLSLSDLHSKAYPYGMDQGSFDYIARLSLEKFLIKNCKLDVDFTVATPNVHLTPGSSVKSIKLIDAPYRGSAFRALGNSNVTNTPSGIAKAIA